MNGCTESHVAPMEVLARRAWNELLSHYWVALPHWGGLGALLMGAHWSLSTGFGDQVAMRFGLDEMALDAAGLGGLFTSAFVLATGLWALYALTLWQPVAVRATALTRWLGETTAIAASVFTGVALVALGAAFVGSPGAIRLVLAIGLLTLLLVTVNLLLALVQGFAAEDARRKMGGAMLLVVIAIAAFEFLRRL